MGREGGARRRKIDQRGWGLACRWKGDGATWGRGEGVCGPGGFERTGRTARTAQDGLEKTFQDTRGIDVAPAVR